MSDREPYNLISRPWIPVHRQQSGFGWISPCQITENYDSDPVLRLAAPRPDFNGALHEFLIGLLTTCFMPGDETVWNEFWPMPPTPDQLEPAFEKYAFAFNLDGDGPRFMQDFDPLTGETVPIGALLMDQPGGNTLNRNADLFTHRGAISSLGPAAAAMALFTLQTYAPSGGAGFRTSMRGGGPLTTLVISGTTLWQRLWPNVETAEQVANRPGLGGAIGPEKTFPWLAPTRTSKKDTGHQVTPNDAHALQVYWGMPRRIRLDFAAGNNERCGLTGRPEHWLARTCQTQNYGINYSDGWQHPLSPYYQPKKADPLRLPVHPQPGGVTYRHWLGLTLQSADGMKTPARCIVNVQEARDRAISEPRLSAFGYDMDNMKARAWVTSEMPLQFFPDQATKERVTALTIKMVGAAEYVAGQLTGAIKRALFDSPKDAKGDFSHIPDRFWRQTEPAFFALLRRAGSTLQEPSGQTGNLETELARKWLGEDLRPTAEDLFDEYASSTDIQFKDMHRLVSARYSLISTLRGAGIKKTAPGVVLFALLNIPTPATVSLRKSQTPKARP